MDREAQIIALMPSAEQIAVRYRRRMPWLDIDDLRSEAYMALVLAVDTYDPALGELGPRVAAKVSYALADYVRSKRTCTVRTPRKAEFARLADMPVIATLPRHDERIDRSKLCRRVRAAIAALPPQNRSTAEDMLSGLTLEQAAARHGVGAGAITLRRRYLRGAMERMRLRFRLEGIGAAHHNP